MLAILVAIRGVVRYYNNADDRESFRVRASDRDALSGSFLTAARFITKDMT